jgi:hypothetical protein
MPPIPTSKSLLRWTWSHNANADAGLAESVAFPHRNAPPPKDMDQHDIETLPEFYPGQYAVEDFEDASGPHSL